MLQPVGKQASPRGELAQGLYLFRAQPHLVKIEKKPGTEHLPQKPHEPVEHTRQIPRVQYSLVGRKRVADKTDQVQKAKRPLPPAVHQGRQSDVLAPLAKEDQQRLFVAIDRLQGR